ncbi:glycine cleavage system H protein [Coniosporium apollinis CBS 100218]|uniref:Glycine cleavage system H protein n=1 Tax=Coniosporium apollinis (strain CBS 100218) TaxID=1168221 RepID=R7Z6M3_CONA1|nr:glycine cleavage system H protein [Coniosporium apollinis CBS 100218]EON69753.1 glycine cleavage system H protein [Coniosporium apollinis CBS 100218]
MAARLSIARAVCQISSRRTCAAFRPVRAQWQQPYSRSFSCSIAARAKKYTEDHEWIELSSDGKTGTIGISTYAANALGDVVYVELPTSDLEVKAGEAIGAVESVKSASDINSPVSGKIIEGNSVLEEKPGTINNDPEGSGWIAKIEVADSGEMERLMDEGGYKEFTEGLE